MSQRNRSEIRKRVVEITQYEERKKKKKKKKLKKTKHRDSLRELWDSIKHTTLAIQGSQKNRERKRQKT